MLVFSKNKILVKHETFDFGMHTYHYMKGQTFSDRLKIFPLTGRFLHSSQMLM